MRSGSYVLRNKMTEKILRPKTRQDQNRQSIELE